MPTPMLAQQTPIIYWIYEPQFLYEILTSLYARLLQCNGFSERLKQCVNDVGALQEKSDSKRSKVELNFSDSICVPSLFRDSRPCSGVGVYSAAVDSIKSG